MGAASRRKGASAEREVAQIIERVTGARLRRKLTQYQQSGDCDLEPVDAAAEKLFGAHYIEIKRRNRMSTCDRDRWWKDLVISAAAQQLEPVLIFRGDRESWRVRWLQGPAELVWNQIQVEADLVLWLEIVILGGASRRENGTQI